MYILCKKNQHQNKQIKKSNTTYDFSMAEQLAALSHFNFLAPNHQHTTPHHTTPHHTTPHHIPPPYTTPHHSTSHNTTPHHTTPHYTTPHHTVPYHTTACRPAAEMASYWNKPIISWVATDPDFNDKDTYTTLGRTLGPFRWGEKKT